MSNELKPTNNQVNVLLEWCAANHVFIDPQIRIALGERGGIGVFSTEGFIPPNYTLARIPKDAVLSARSCSLGAYVPLSPYGLEAQLALSLALYVEILRGPKSRWHGYLQSFTAGTVDLPMFWSLDTTDTSKDGDGKEALAWLRGTEASKIINATSEDGLTTLEEINRFYHDFAEPVLLRHANVWRCAAGAGSSGAEVLTTLTEFYRAFSLVSSRAFLLDAYHGLSMVPIADAFNHVVENHVHLESDYNVCPECGSLQECPHDAEDGPQVRGRTACQTKVNKAADDHDLSYDMISNTGIPPFSEIYNTYGEELTNAQLLNQYGFILDVNDNDRLSWTIEEILRVFSPDATIQTTRPQLLTPLQDILSWLTEDHPIFSQSRLVYYEESFDGRFYLNGEGILSHQLWSILFIVALFRRQLLSTKVDLQQTLLALLDYQVSLEAKLGDEGEDAVTHGSMFRLSDSQVLGVLLDIGEMVMTLCAHRKRSSGKVGSHSLDLLSVLEELPKDAVRTQLALSILMSERSVLDCCESEWGDLTSALKTVLNDEA